jgi:hypothetical protein
VRLNFTAVLFQKTTVFKLTLAILLLSATNAISDERSKSLSPLAPKVFEYCMDAAIESRELTEQQLTADLRSSFEELSGSASGSLTVEVDDDFQCYVQIPTESYDPRMLRELLVTLQASSFNGRTRRCGWLVGIQGGRASVLQCSLRGKSDPANSFQVNVGILPDQGAMFWIKPVLIYDDDGFVRLGD